MTDIARAGPGASPYVPDAVRPPPGGPGRPPPRTGLADLLRLGGAMAGGLLRERRAFSARLAFREWAADAALRHGSPDLVLDFVVKRVLLVGTPAASADILAAPPSGERFVAGALKRDAMTFLAPNALTIAQGADWTRLRALNERVLDTGRPHDHADLFLAHVRDAFRAPSPRPPTCAAR